MTITPITRRDAVRGMGALTLAATLAIPSAKAAAAVGQGTGRVSIPGGDLAYWIVGEGRGIPLLMVHGGPGGNHLYMKPLASLGSDRPIIFYDQLDCGESDHPNNPANWTVERFVSEIDPIRDALGLSELHILGSSYGGLFAAEYAARQPKGLRGCILAGPVVNTPRSFEDQTTLVKL
jgi:proline-specific peptidase